MATLDERYRINGLIDTSQTAISNLEKIVAACNTWLTYDSIEGKWSVVINQASEPVVTFTDADIVGGISLATTELGTFYNSCEVRYHNQELRDQPDFVLLETPPGQRLGQEPDNRITIDSSLINNQIQAQLMGLIELKQSRLEKTIEFVVDYKHLGLDAGSVIAITNAVYGWTDQPFRILRIDQREQNGALVLGIRAQEYKASVYDTSDLFQYLVEKEDGVFQLDPYKDSPPFTPTQQVVDANGNVVTTNSPWNLMRGLDGLYSGYRIPGQPSGILYNSLSNELLTDPAFANGIANTGSVYSTVETITGSIVAESSAGNLTFTNNVSNVLGDTSTFWAAGNSAVGVFAVGGPATMVYAGSQGLSIGSGPWPSGVTANTASAGDITTGYSYVIADVNVYFNGTYDPEDIDPTLSANVKMYIGNSVVATNSSSLLNSPFLGKDFNIPLQSSTEIAPNQSVYFEVTIISSLASSATVSIRSYQIKGTTNYDNYTEIKP